MRSAGEMIGAGFSLVARVLVSLLWLGGGAIAVSAQEWVAVGVVAAYLAYLWLFGGRWLIY